MGYATVQVNAATAVEKDFRGFLNVYNNICYLGHEGLKAHTKPLDRYEYNKFTTDERIYLARFNGEIVGYIIVSVYEDSPDTCKIEEIAVLPPFRRKNIANALIRKVQEDAMYLHITKLEVFSATTETDRFWERKGFNHTIGDSYIKVIA